MADPFISKHIITLMNYHHRLIFNGELTLHLGVIGTVNAYASEMMYHSHFHGHCLYINNFSVISQHKLIISAKWLLWSH